MRANILGITAALLVSLTVLPGISLAKYASYVVDADTGEVFHSVNADTRNYPASLTKIMTLYMVFDALENKKLRLNQKLSVSRAATRARPSKLGLRKGDKLSVKDAILALVTKSANDAAIVVAEALAGSEKEFARQMTAKARQIGMKSTTFKNASGLPNRGQKSTARDMARLGLQIRKQFPQYYNYFNTWKFSYQGRKYYNHNKLLKSYEGTDGIKTGFINASGFNLVASVERDGRRLIGVVFGGRTGKSRNAHMKKLLDKAFRSIKLATIRPIARPTLINGQLPVALDGNPADENPFVEGPQIQTAAVTGDSKPAAGSAGTFQPLNRKTKPAWGIQVGAFKQKFRAQQAARKAATQVRTVSDHFQIVISNSKSRSNKLYQARLVGFTEPQARHACNIVVQSKLACVPVVIAEHERVALRGE